MATPPKPPASALPSPSGASPGAPPPLPAAAWTPPPGPSPTTDLVIERDGAVLLVARRFPPHGWALPGGFVDAGETVADAAVREAREETGLDVRLTALLHVYSDPARDRRRHTMSVVWVAEADGEPVGGDDAAEARFFPWDALPSPIVFDHGQILADYRHFRATGERPPPHR